MKVLVIGKGGREHAIVRALKHSISVNEVHVVPGNDGMKQDAICHELKTNDFDGIGGLLKRHSYNLVVIGPEVEIVAGLSDFIRAQDVPVFAPSKEAGQLEGSKLFAKQFMNEFNIPTAAYHVVRSVSETVTKANEFNPPYILKADGLAAGKGVSICQSLAELTEAATNLFEKKIFGEAGKMALLEDCQHGWELSVHILTNGSAYTCLPLSQDNKRLEEGDKGPNTGGMGVVGPIKIDKALEVQINNEILKPTVAGLSQRSFCYRGALYVGIMVTKDGPKVIEYNCRFGDPETQVLMPLLDGDWGEVMLALAKGKINDLQWKKIYAACVVMAAEGYPENPKKGGGLTGNPFFESSSSYYLHAGTRKATNTPWETNGGRVLNAIGIGTSLQEAIDQSYLQTSKVQWEGIQMRKDIGQKALAMNC